MNPKLFCNIHTLANHLPREQGWAEKPMSKNQNQKDRDPTRRDQNQKDRSKNWVAFKDGFFWSIQTLSHNNRMEQIDRSLYESGHSQEPCDTRELWLLNIARTMVTFLFGIVEILFHSLIIYILEKCPKHH
jgi:hypothetical protein